MGSVRAQQVEIVTDLLMSLDNVDDYGVPPLSVYQRFNSVGADLHGQCAVAQGARGCSMRLTAGFNFAKLLPVCAPLTLSASAEAGGMRLATASVVLYRLPAKLTASGASQKPIGLAQLNGVTWSGKAKLQVNAGVALDLFKILAGFNISATAGLTVDSLTSRLVAPETQHFADVGRAELVRAVDDILAVEIKKACVAILAANKDWLTRNLPAIAREAGVTGLPAAAETAGVDIKKAAKDEVASTLRKVAKEQGWYYVVAGCGVVAVASLATFLNWPSISKAVKEFFAKNDSDVLKQLDDLQAGLNFRRDVLQAEADDPSKTVSPDELAELADLTEACIRLVGFRTALFRKQFSPDQIFANRRPQHTGAVAEVDDAYIARPGGSSLALTSFNWAVNGDFDGSANVSTLAAKGKANAGVEGRNVSFRFRMRGSNSVDLVQDTHTCFLQTSVTAAANASMFHTGLAEADKRLFADMKQLDLKTPKDLGRRRFGALTYRAANVYYDTQDGAVMPMVSGVSLGVSVRVNPLCDYADAIRATPVGPLDATLTSFETWVCDQLGCKPASLREFVVDAPLGADYRHTEQKVGRHAVGYPVDALILEAGYGVRLQRGTRLAQLAKGDVEPVDLFAYHSFTTLESWTSDVRDGKRDLTVMRLRYRIQSPLTPTSTKTPEIGLPSRSPLPLKLNFDFGRESEVGVESIVDLHTRFSEEFEVNGDTEQTKYELNMPPVVLFNRG